MKVALEFAIAFLTGWLAGQVWAFVSRVLTARRELKAIQRRYGSAAQRNRAIGRDHSVGDQ